MPTYEYRCKRGHSFDVFQKMSDPPVAQCPECGADAERQIVPGAGFLFKGDGFYITDSRSEDYKKRAATDNPPAVVSPGKGESKGKAPTRPEGGAKSDGKQESGAKESARKEAPAKEARPSKGKSSGGN